MIKDNYECDGQMDIFDFLGKESKEPHYCEGCLWIFHEGREGPFCERVLFLDDMPKCMDKITADEGWRMIYKTPQGYTGDFPECPKWQKIEIWSYIEEYDKYVHGFAEAKDKTIKRNLGGDIGDVRAWRYV